MGPQSAHQPRHRSRRRRSGNANGGRCGDSSLLASAELCDPDERLVLAAVRELPERQRGSRRAALHRRPVDRRDRRDPPGLGRERSSRHCSRRVDRWPATLARRGGAVMDHHRRARLPSGADALADAEAHTDVEAGLARILAGEELEPTTGRRAGAGAGCPRRGGDRGRRRGRRGVGVSGAFVTDGAEHRARADPGADGRVDKAPTMIRRSDDTVTVGHRAERQRPESYPRSSSACVRDDQ